MISVYTEDPLKQIGFKVAALVNAIKGKEEFKLNIFPLLKALEESPILKSEIKKILDASTTQWIKLRDITYCLFVEDQNSKNRDFHQLVLDINRLVQNNATQGYRYLQADLLEAIRDQARESDLNPRSYLENRKFYSIEPKSLAHIHAGPAIKNSGWEGYTYLATLRLMIKYLNDSTRKDSPQVQTFILLLRDAIPFNEKYNFAPKTPQELHETKNDFCEALRKILSSADSKKTLLFPLGWIGTPGHAIYLQAIRTDAKHFKVIIFNSGSGLDYHDRLIIDGTSTHQTCLELEGVPQENLTNDAFLTAWLELLTVIKTNPGEPTNYSRKDIYEGLILSLRGKRVVPSTKIEDYTLATKAGVCAWGALVAAAKYNLNESDFRRVHFEIRLNSLCDFFQSHKDRFAFQSELLLLAEKSCEQFARDVLLDLKQETISREEAMRVHATLKEMFSHLEHARQWAHYQSYTHSKIDLTKIDQVPLLQMNSKSDLPPEPTLKQVDLQSPRLYPLYNDFEGIDRVETLLPKIIAFRTWCEQFPPFVFNVSLSLSLEKFYEKLKSPTAENNFWDRLTNEQATQCMHELVLIGEIAFKNTPKDIEKKYHYLAAAMGSLKSTAILWSLAKKMNPPFMQGAYFPLHAILEHWFLRAPGTDQDKNAYDAEMRAYLHEIVNYFRHPSTAAAVNEVLINSSLCHGVCGFDNFDEFEGTKDGIYANQQLDDLNFRNRLFKEEPELISESRHHQVNFLLCDLEGRFMPPIFCYLRKQLLLASYLAQGKSPKKLYKNNRISFPIKDNFSRENVLSLENSLSHEGLARLFRISRQEHTIVSKDEPKFQIIWTSTNSTKHLEKTMSPNDLELFLKDCPPYSLAEMKELLALMPRGDGEREDPHFEAQVITTLSYFQKNLLKLQNPEFQEFFRLLVFEHDHLEVLLKNNPQLVLILSDFIKTGLGQFADLADFSTPLFFIELSRTFEKIVQKTLGKTALGKTVGEFPDPLQFLRLLLERDLSIELRVFVYKHLAASYMTHGPQKLHPEGVEELLHALSYIRKYDNKTYRHSLYLQKEFDTSLIHFQEQIKEHIQGANGDGILSRICQRLRLPSTTETWDKNGYPLCTTCDGLSLDLSTGNIYQQNQKSSSIPKNINECDPFIEAFGKCEYDVQVLNNGQYVFEDKLGIKCKLELVYKNEKIEIKCKKEISGVWFIYSGIYKYPLFYRHTTWIPLQANFPYVWLLSEKEHRPTYRISEDKVEKIDHEGKMWAIGDPNSSNNPFGGKLFLFKNETGELKLENLSYGLTFYLRKQDQKWTVLSKEYPGYRYALNQYVKGLEGFTEGFVLENKKGHRKLLLPRRPIEVGKGAFAQQVEFAKPEDKIPEMMLFDIDPKRGVVPTTKEQQLMLAYIQFGRKEYITAQENLRKSLSHAIPYTANEQEILKWIFNLNLKMEDGDPASLALTLTALCLMIQGYSNLDLHEDKIDWEKQSDLFLEYLTCCPPSTALTVDEEKILITHLVKLLKNKLKKIEEELAACKTFNFVLMLQKRKLEDRIDNLSQRYRFLTQSQAHQKVQSLSACLTPEWYFNGEEGFQKVIDYIKVRPWHKKEPYPLITRPGDFFRQRILEDKFYSEIRDQDPGARVILNLAKRDQSVPRLLIEVLEAVWQKPDEFPGDDRYLKNPGEHKETWLSIIGTAAGIQNADTGTQRELPSLTISKGNPASTPTLKKEEIRALLKMPPLTEYEIHFEEVDFVGIKLTTEEIKELKQAVDISNKSPLAAVKSKELQKDIEAAWSNTPQKRPYLKVQEAILLKQSLQKKLELENDLLANRTKELLALANAAPQDPEQKTIRGLDRQGGFLRPVTLNDLCLILARNDAGTLKKLNPTLNDREIQVIYEQTLMVLERAKRVQRIERTLVDLDNLLQRKRETTSDLTKDLIYLDLSQRIRDQLTRPTAYDPVENPEYSLFEYIANIQLFEGQVKDLKELNTERVRLILQKIMGSGKSKVYLPLLALKKADGKTLTVVVVPAFQYDTTLRDMEASSGQIFAQVTHTLKFNRENDCSESGLRKLREDLQEIVAKKEYLVVTDKTIHCLIDKAKEMTLAYFELGEPLPPVPPALKEMRLLLKMFRKGILDEADLILNGRHEVNFTIGEPQSVKKEHAAVVRALYECLFNKDLLKKIIPENSAEATLTPEQFKQEILPELAKAIFERHFKEIKEKDLIIDYWMNGSKGHAFVATLNDEKLQNRLAIVKEELTELLPITLCKTINLRYGKSDDGSELLAVPYVGNNKPSPTSRFGNPYELLNFTTQLYLLQGVQENTLRPLVEKLKMRAIRELTADPELKTATNTLAYQEFLALCDDKNMNLMCVTDSDFKKIVLRYKDNKTAVLDFLERYIYPLVAIHPGKITSHHLSLVELFEDEIIGFTGTPWNSDLFHAHLRVHFETGADGKTLGILKKNSSADIIHLNTHKHGEILEELFKGHDETSPFRTLQDTGSIFNGIDNRLIAEEILKRAPANIKGVKFFAENNQVEILERDKKESVPLSKCQLTPEECFTYYDQWHTTSTDIKQMRNAKGFVTIGKTLNSRDLRQGVWRLREIDKCQIAALVVAPEAATLIRAELGMKPEEKITFDAIIKFNEINLNRELENQLPSNVLQKVNHVTEQAIWRILSDPETDLSKMAPSISLLKEILRKGQEDTPYKNFGRKEESVETLQLLNEKIQSDLEILTSLQKKNKAEFAKIDPIKHEENIGKAIPRKVLPARMNRPIRMNRELTIEVEREQDKEKEVNVLRVKELENETEGDLRRNIIPHWNWSTVIQATPTQREFFKLWTMKEMGDIKLEKLPEQLRIYTKSHGIPPVMTLQELFANSKGFQEYADVFCLETTYNFLPMTSRLKLDMDVIQRAVPFDSLQLDAEHFLILQDRKTKERRMLLLAPPEVRYFLRQLGKEKHKNAAEKEISIVLGNTKGDVLNSDDDAVAQEIVNSPEWNRCITEAKFFNGELKYKEKEQEYLKKWIKAKGVERMETLFFQRILRHKPEQKKEYSGSILYRIFNSLIKS